MINSNLLNTKISESGVKQVFIARKLGMKPATLKSRIINDTEFKVSEAKTIADILHLTDQEFKDIFFA